MYAFRQAGTVFKNTLFYVMCERCSALSTVSKYNFSFRQTVYIVRLHQRCPLLAKAARARCGTARAPNNSALNVEIKYLSRKFHARHRPIIRSCNFDVSFAVCWLSVFLAIFDDITAAFACVISYEITPGIAIISRPIRENASYLYHKLFQRYYSEALLKREKEKFTIFAFYH